MADKINELRELMDHYRRKARSVGILPLAAAYGEAADRIEETIVEIGPAKQEASRQAFG
jgi:hypothetical protein